MLILSLIQKRENLLCRTDRVIGTKASLQHITKEALSLAVSLLWKIPLVGEDTKPDQYSLRSLEAL